MNFAWGSFFRGGGEDFFAKKFLPAPLRLSLKTLVYGFDFLFAQKLKTGYKSIKLSIKNPLFFFEKGEGLRMSEKTFFF